MLNKIKHLTIGLVSIAVGATAWQFVTAGLWFSVYFPFGGCLAPWWADARYSCLVDIARVTGKVSICEHFLPDRDDFRDCISAIAVAKKSADICARWLGSSTNPRCRADTYLCMSNVQQQMPDAKLCEPIVEGESKSTCINVYETHVRMRDLPSAIFIVIVY